MKTFLNYLGQLRLYSLIDWIFFLIALSPNTALIIGGTLLWVSFILYLESRHNDPLRLRVPKIAWLIPWVLSFLFVPLWLPGIFAVLVIGYTSKKKSAIWGATSPLWRGAINAAVAYAINPRYIVLAFVFTALRNLIGDFRDSGTDSSSGTKTIPVLLGFTRNSYLAYILHALLVVASTIYWWNVAGTLSLSILIMCVSIELLSYPLTPRLANPRFLDLYSTLEQTRTKH